MIAHEFRLVKIGSIAVVSLISLVYVHNTFLAPYLHIWEQRMAGQAELARAESNRQIATLEALAKKESSKALAEAEVIRADGMAKANKIIGDSLQDNAGIANQSNASRIRAY